MTEPHEIDEYVRRLAPVSDEAVAALTGTAAKASLYERVAARLDPVRTVTGPRRWRTRLVLAGAMAGVALLSGSAGIVATRLLDPAGDAPAGDAPSPPVWAAPGDPGRESLTAPDGAALCLAPDPHHTALVFDGTVTEIRDAVHVSIWPGSYVVGVRFRVNQWLYGEQYIRGGGAQRGAPEEVTVMMPPSGEGFLEGYEMPDYQVGGRLLVAAKWWWDGQRAYPFTGGCWVSQYDSALRDRLERRFLPSGADE